MLNNIQYIRGNFCSCAFKRCTCSGWIGWAKWISIHLLPEGGTLHGKKKLFSQNNTEQYVQVLKGCQSIMPTHKICNNKTCIHKNWNIRPWVILAMIPHRLLSPVHEGTSAYNTFVRHERRTLQYYSNESTLWNCIQPVIEYKDYA